MIEAIDRRPAEFDFVRLGDEWPDAHIEAVPPDPSRPLEELYATIDEWLAAIIAQQLTARGIWCEVEQDWRKDGSGIGVRTWLYHCLMVSPDERERAEAILDAFRTRP